MDSKLTKKRLSDFFSYEWILTLIVAAVAIVAMELIYTVSAARLSTGQQFKFYLDEDLSSFESYSVYELLDVKTGENGKTFSYDVLSVETENLTSSYNVLSVRLSVQEGDAIFTSAAEKEDKSVRAKTLIDEFSVYDLDGLYNSANEYLSQFKTAESFDEDAIRAYFDKRMKGDNRFRTETEKEEGRENEIARIKKLAKDVEDFGKLLNSETENLFYYYTKYEQASNGDVNDKNYGAAYAKTKENGALRYGINMAVLTGGKKNVSDYLKLGDTGSAENVVLLLFDFSSFQYDLQFESISFVCTLVREFSDILG